MEDIMENIEQPIAETVVDRARGSFEALISEHSALESEVVELRAVVLMAREVLSRPELEYDELTALLRALDSVCEP